MLSRLGTIAAVFLFSLGLAGWTGPGARPFKYSATPVIDSAALRSVNRMHKAIMAAQSVSVTLRVNNYTEKGTPKQESVVIVKIMRPDQYLIRNKYRYYKDSAWGNYGNGTYGGSGSSQMTHFNSDSTYKKKIVVGPAPVRDAGLYSGFFLGKDWEGSSPGDWSLSKLSDAHLIALRNRGMEMWKGENCQVVEWEYKYSYEPASNDYPYVTRIYVGPDDLPRYSITTRKGYTQSEVSYEDTRVNTVTLSELNFPVAADVKMVDDTGNKLNIGTIAPLFTLTSLDGNQVSLADAIGKGRIVMLKGFSLSCNTCRAELMKMDQVYREYKDTGVDFYAIFDKGASDTYGSFIMYNKLTMPFLLRDENEKSPIDDYKNLYFDAFIIDQNGKVVYADVPNRSAMKRAIESVVVKPKVRSVR